MGNGKLGSGNPGSFANSTVILLFIWNVDMQLLGLYIKLSAVIYATLLNCQLVAVFSVSAITQIRQKPTPLFAVEALLSQDERTPTTLLQPFHRRI